MGKNRRPVARRTPLVQTLRACETCRYLRLALPIDGLQGTLKQDEKRTRPAVPGTHPFPFLGRSGWESGLPGVEHPGRYRLRDCWRPPPALEMLLRNANPPGAHYTFPRPSCCANKSTGTERQRRRRRRTRGQKSGQPAASNFEIAGVLTWRPCPCSGSVPATKVQDGLGEGEQTTKRGHA